MENDFKAGSVIGGYTLESYLGGGSFGAVWRARHEETGQLAALKLLTGALSSSETAGMRAEVEMLAAFAASRSEHVVHILGGGPDPIPYVVMEYIEGSDVSSLLRNQAHLSQDQTIEAGIAIADALRALNEAGIIHRDIKPANVMIDNHGVFKLTDFGIAKIVGYETMTMTGQAAMTMAYAAPEIWDEGSAFGRASHKSDLYAMGILLFQCLTGETPFRGNYGALYKAHTERTPDINALPPDTPPSLKQLISACLEKKQENRPAGAEACLLMLERSRVELGEASGRIPEHEPSRFGPWVRDSIHPTMPWAWYCRHQSSGDRATVELHFAENLEYGAHLRKAVAANSKLAPLGAERLLETNRLLLRPEEAWTAPLPGQFQFWVAREDRDVSPVSEVTPAVLLPAAAGLAALTSAAAAEGVGLKLRDNLTILKDGDVYLKRPAIESGVLTSENEAMDILRAAPLSAEAAALLTSSGSLKALVEAYTNPSPENATIMAPRGDETMYLGRDAGATVFVAPSQPVEMPQMTTIAPLPSRPAPAVVYCTNCGEPALPGQSYCANCGTRSGVPVAPTGASAAAGAAVFAGGAAAGAALVAAVRMELRRTNFKPNTSDYELVLQNSSSQVFDLAISASDAAGTLGFNLAPRLTLLGGAQQRLPVHVSTLKKRMFGGKRSTPFTIVAAGGGGNGQPPLVVNGDFEDEPAKTPIFAGGGILGIAAIAVAGAVMLGGGGSDNGGALAQASELTPTVVAATATSVPATPTGGIL